MKGKRQFLVLGLLFAVIASAMTIVNPKITQIIIDKVFRGDKDEKLFWWLVITMLSVHLLTTVIRYIMVQFLEICSQKALVTIERKIFATLVTQEPDFYDRNRTGDIISRATGDLEYIRHIIAGISHIFIESVVMLISVIIMLSTMHIGLTVAMLIITPIMSVMTFKYSRYIRPFYVTLRNKSAHINTVAQENLSGNRVVKAFAMEEFEKEKFGKACKDLVDYNIGIVIKHQKFAQTLSFMTNMLGVILILVGGYFLLNSEGKTGVWALTLGELGAFSAMRFQLANPLQNIGTIINDLQRFFASADKVMEIFYSKPIIADRHNSVDTDRRLSGSIKFDNVSFAFKDKTVFENISFDIKPGETIAIMGPTGSGKTTLINLLCRQYEPTKGKIYIDGVDVHMWKLSKLHTSIGVATQDVFLFSDTINSNIAYGNPQMSQKDIKTYSKVADADNFISGLDDKYDTVVGERGVGLSGGQRQRIALARALAVKPPILVLDDTTSAVDMETEKHIQDELEKIDFSCTKIIVAQRISSVRRADRIFILAGGKLEIGTHESLSSVPGYYREICKLQNVPDLVQLESEQEEVGSDE